MKIIRLQVSGVKRLVAVDITPGEGMNRVGGFNGEGKSSLLDSIAMAFGGVDAIPMKPLRTGEEYGVIRIDVGDGEEAELRVTRFFNDDGTTSLKVQTGDGATFDKGQTKLNDIIGLISFDPVKFADMDPKAQAVELRRLVPLAVDLDKLAADDKADTTARRDINRDAKAKLAQVEAIIVPADLPAEKPDREAIVAALGTAGATNAAIERERNQREVHNRERERTLNGAFSWREEAKNHRRLADEADAKATQFEEVAEKMAAIAAAFSPLDEPVDTAKLSADLNDADRVLRLFAAKDQHAALKSQYDELRVQSDAYTKRLTDRQALREKALADAKMPVEGLSFGMVGDDMVVTFNGEPFAQSSRAEQIRVSMRLAMAANPKLRVMTIRDGSLLDARGFKLISEIAAEGDYQVFVEVVGEGEENGIIIEDGRVKGAPDPERIEPPKRRKAKTTDDLKAEGGPVQSEATDAAQAAKAQAAGWKTPLAPEILEPIPDERNAMGDEKPAKRKPTAMRSFSTKPLELFE